MPNFHLLSSTRTISIYRFFTDADFYFKPKKKMKMLELFDNRMPHS